MGTGAAMSAAIWPSTFFCAAVGLKGSIFFTCSRTRGVSAKAMPCSVRAWACFSAMPVSSQKNSSKIRRYCAGERKLLSSRRSVPGAGKCTSRIADSSPGRRSLRAMDSGSASGMCGSASVSRFSTARNTRVVTFPAAS